MSRKSKTMRISDQISSGAESDISLVSVTFALEDVLLNKLAGDEFDALTQARMIALIDEICEYYQLDMYQIQHFNGKIQVRIMAEEQYMNVFQDAVRHFEV